MRLAAGDEITRELAADDDLPAALRAAEIEDASSCHFDCDEELAARLSPPRMPIARRGMTRDDDVAVATLIGFFTAADATGRYSPPSVQAIAAASRCLVGLALPLLSILMSGAMPFGAFQDDYLMRLSHASTGMQQGRAWPRINASSSATSKMPSSRSRPRRPRAGWYSMTPLGRVTR